jgi:hypothetical protein
MNNNIKNQIMLIIMILIVLESFGEIKKKENHPIENEFSNDTFLRINLTSAASITASPAIDSMSIKTLQDFMHKLK